MPSKTCLTDRPMTKATKGYRGFGFHAFRFVSRVFRGGMSRNSAARNSQSSESATFVYSMY
jgi:hypothetical protein